ncbi:MAG: DUF3667 domain-containing protein [Gemmatimonadaceae bacterium]|nr:DUF3667 domain-containing protein [Chitinophagaceae bacterium]
MSKVSPAANMEAEVCRSCGSSFRGNFCNVCGEKRFVERDKTMRHFFDETFHFLTHFDSKFLRSLWLVLSKPGFVSAEVTNGARKRYFKPLNLFLIGVVLYLLFPFFQGLNMPLRGHLNELYKEFTAWLIRQKMASQHIDFEEIARRFDSKSPKFAKVLLFLVIPFSALGLKALFPKRKKYFFDHMMLAAELNTFYLYFVFFIIPGFFMALMAYCYAWGVFIPDGGFGLDDGVTLPGYLVCFVTYAALAFIRFYGAGKTAAIFKAILFMLMHMTIVYLIYRVILLAVIFLFI